MPDDGTLLREYAGHGSESAFTALVAQHIDLVYSTALRAVHGNEALAQDVSQAVFLDLARKAVRLSGRPDLTGWLYVSTCYAGAKAVRTESRRRLREQEAHAMHQSLGNAPDPDWEQIGPLLNDAMLSLSEADREVLLLRFFARHPLSEVGRKLGVTENAARMRVDRALERLRIRLTGSGITSSAAALALVLTQQAVLAAPAGLAVSVSAASIAGAAATGGISMLPANTWTNLGFGTPAAALQTLNWAAMNRDTNAFLNAVAWDPQVRARAESLFADLPENVRQQYGSVDGVIMDWMLSHATPVAAFRVLNQTEQGADDVTLLEQHQYTDDRVRENPVQFHRDENGAWRQVIPPEMMPKLQNVMNNLAGTPGVGASGK